MAKPGDNTVALAAGMGALLGIGVLAGVAIAGGFEDRRAAFSDNLRAQLQLSGIELIAATLGRKDDTPIWVLSLQLPNQHVTTIHAQVHEGEDPLSAVTCGAIAERVARRFLPQLRAL